jgi:hypothetical protein
MKDIVDKLKTLKLNISYFILILAPLPFFYFLTSFYSQMESLSFLEERIEKANNKAVQYALNKKREERFFAQMKDIDYFYLDKHVETLTFLEPEIKRLEAILLSEEQDEPLKKRLHHLTEGPNRLGFLEEVSRSSDRVREAELKLKKPVELNDEDLKKMLSLIEGVSIGGSRLVSKRPQLIIKNFELTKKPLSYQEGVYIINFQMIKREVIKGAK